MVFAASCIPALLFAAWFLAHTEANAPSELGAFFNYGIPALAAGDIRPVNSQTIPLLEAGSTSSSSSLESPQSGDITIVDGNSLLANAGSLNATTSQTASYPDQPNQNEPAEGQISTYSVQEGDTISGIAAMFKVTTNTILWANGIHKGTPLKVGQSLVILPISGLRYKVQKGDTPASIAKKFKGDANEILQFNNIADDTQLAFGTTIIIPHGEAPSIEAVSQKPKRVVAVKETLAMPSVPAVADKTEIDGYFMRPIMGGIKTQGLHGWNAVDLASSFAAPIFAAAAGQVIVARESGWNGGYGNYIVISHPNGTQTLYAHLSSLRVQSGDTVTQGQVIGAMGQTGEATGVHLHFEVRGGVNPF